MYTTFKDVEKEYRKKVQNTLEDGKCLTAALLLELSLILFTELKIKNISDSKDKDNDMLLYQYGIYDWGDEFGEHFSIDITRQFIKPTEDEPYQLSFTLIFESEQFKGLESHNCWSSHFSDLESFIAHIKTTDGFKLAERSVPKTYVLQFSQC